MTKPGVLPGRGTRRPTIETQAHMAQAEALLKVWHLGQPWACAISLMPLAGVFHFFFPGFWTAVAVALAGCVIAGIDRHLRGNRLYRIARTIGPVTILCATGWLTASLVIGGFPKPLVLTWVLGGITGSLVWDGWMLAGEHKDMTRQFSAAGASSGIGGAWLSGLTRHKRHLSATMHLPGGEVTMKDAAAKVENLEGAMGHAPGSWTLSPDPANAGQAQVRISDPQVLAEPLPWPYGLTGSNPGASIAEPIHPGLWQDGEEVEYCLLNHHMIGMGKTGSGKTTSWAYNQIGEGVTRIDYACFGIDVVKRYQFMGALQPALHQLIVEPEEVPRAMAAFYRMTSARADFLGKNHLIEWRPGCGLTFLDIFLEEAPDTIQLLGTNDKSPERLAWVSSVRTGRTAGERWNLSHQRSDFTQVPPLVRGQMGKMCFGVDSAADAEFGLSEEQRKRGCRPQLWGEKFPGKCYIDALSIPDERIGMPLRFWDWGRDSSMMAAYAMQWPASGRPLDDVTGEAWEAEPGPAASTAFAAGPAVTGKPDLHVVPLREKYKPPVKMTPQQSFEIIRDQVDEWRKQGRDVFRASDLGPLVKKLRKTNQWIYGPLDRLEEHMLIRKLPKPPGVGITKWQILPQADEKEAGE